MREIITQKFIGQDEVREKPLKELILPKQKENLDCFNMQQKDLPNEEWKQDQERKRNKFEASNYGRIKLNGDILKQIDSPDYGNGWLVLEKFPSVLVYQLVADAWLEYPSEGSGYHIHHIDNIIITIISRRCI